jgi:hypothetical protein
VTPVRRVWALVLVSAVLLAGCKVNTQVDVTLRPDGTGTIAARIALDAGAVQRLTTHAPLTQAVPLADVRAAGWTVSKWLPLAGGGKVITLTHAFVGQPDLTRRIADLSGPSGVLRNPKITRTRGFLDAEDGLAITVDLRNLSTGIRTDAELTKRLTAAGLNVNTLDAQLHAQLNGALHVRVVVHVAGGKSKTVQLTAGGHATVSATDSRTNARRVELLAAGALLLVLALMIMAASSASRSRRRRMSSVTSRR